MQQVMKLISQMDLQAPTYVVGGYVRDSMLGKRCDDLDIICAEPLGVAKHLAKELGGVMFMLKADIGLARVVTAAGIIDFAPFKGATLQEDLLGRDFSINAMAVELKDYLESGLAKLVDPTGGKRDLEQKILRVTNEEALSLDPVRIVRGVRLKGALNLSLDLDTRRLMMDAAPSLRNSAPERIWQEFCKVLVNKHAWRSVAEMFDLGVLAEILPELAGLAEVEQNYYHRENAWLHSLGALKAMEDILTGGLLPEKIEREIERYTEHRIGQAQVKEMLKFTALMHDVGKKATQTRRSDGRISFYGHDLTGATKFSKAGKRLRISNAEIARISCLIKLHMRCLNLFKSAPVSNKAIHKLLRDAGEDGLGLLILALADGMATAREHPGGEVDPTYREFLLDLMDKLLFAKERFLPRPLLDGREIMGELGVPPGVEVGRLLQQLVTAQVEGLVRSKPEAILYLKQRRKS